jgi:hypothetical protein
MDPVIEMNLPVATKQAGASSDQVGETPRTARQELVSRPKPVSLTDLSRRTPVTTPTSADLLERVQGVARWGLNE